MTKRRTRGDGGLYQRHDHPTCPKADPGTGDRLEHRCQGRWVGTVDVFVNGKRLRKYVYGRTSTETRRKLADALRDKETGTLVVASMTVGTWVDYWLDNIAARSIRPQTLRGYRSKVAMYIKPNLGRIRLAALEPSHIRHMHDTMRAAGLAEASVRQAHAILKRALKIAVQEGKLGSSPAERMESPGTETAKRDQLNRADALRVLKAAGNDPRWWLALFCGFRQGEALGLRWCDVDFDRKLIKVEQSLQTGLDGRIIFGPPKSRASQRTIPMIGVIESRLRLHHLDSGSPRPDDVSLVFTSGGKPIQPKRDWLEWRALLDLASEPPWAPVPQVALHSARNSAASLLEAAGVPDRVVMQIVGHSQVQITHSYQTAELPRAVEAFQSLGRLLELE